MMMMMMMMILIVIIYNIYIYIYVRGAPERGPEVRKNRRPQGSGVQIAFRRGSEAVFWPPCGVFVVFSVCLAFVECLRGVPAGRFWPDFPRGGRMAGTVLRFAGDRRGRKCKKTIRKLRFFEVWRFWGFAAFA